MMYRTMVIILGGLNLRSPSILLGSLEAEKMKVCGEKRIINAMKIDWDE